MFNKARLKLTAWYLLIIMLISLSFSTVIYKVLSDELNRFSRLQRLRIERRLNERKLSPFNYYSPDLLNRIAFDQELAEETKSRLIFFLFLVNSGIFILSGGLAYFLSGKTLKPIEEMHDDQNQFITDASHELKTPLTSLKSAFEVSLRDKDLNLKEAKNIIRESVEEVNKLQSLTENLLLLSQYQQSNLTLGFENLQLSLLLDEAIKKVKPQAVKKNIKIENHAKETNLYGNKSDLVELLVILLDNAVKYSPNGKKVIVTSQQDKNKLNIAFIDEGQGIAEKDLPRIFDRFYRGDHARMKLENGGHGLGLSIAKKIVENHQGTLSVESKIDKGSVFTIRLKNKNI